MCTVFTIMWTKSLNWHFQGGILFALSKHKSYFFFKPDLQTVCLDGTGPKYWCWTFWQFWIFMTDTVGCVGVVAPLRTVYQVFWRPAKPLWLLYSLLNLFIRCFPPFKFSWFHTFKIHWENFYLPHIVTRSMTWNSFKLQ